MTCAPDSTSEVDVGGALLADLARAVIARRPPFRFHAKGGSMSPFIRDGDILTIRPASGRFRSGTVVAFCHPQAGQLVIHRVVSRTTSHVLTRGDALAAADGWIPVRCTVGCVVAAERAGKPVRLGFGPERALIALLSRAGLLGILLWPARKLYKKFFR